MIFQAPGGKALYWRCPPLATSQLQRRHTPPTRVRVSEWGSRSGTGVELDVRAGVRALGRVRGRMRVNVRVRSELGSGFGPD